MDRILYLFGGIASRCFWIKAVFLFGRIIENQQIFLSSVVTGNIAWRSTSSFLIYQLLPSVDFEDTRHHCSYHFQNQPLPFLSREELLGVLFIRATQ